MAWCESEHGYESIASSRTNKVCRTNFEIETFLIARDILSFDLLAWLFQGQ